VPEGQAFYLEFTPNAPHEPATPAPEDENLYRDFPPYRPPNFNPASWPLGGKPAWLTQAPQLSAQQIDLSVDQFRLNQLRSLASLDRAIGAILDELEAEGKLDDTLILFWSDNGYFWGEQRLLSKNHVYEEASHFTFAIRYPPLIQVPLTDDHLVQVIDMGPTIYEITGVAPIGLPFDGRSLVPLLAEPKGWRDALLLEGWPNDPNNPGLMDHYQALRCSDCVAPPSGSSGQFVYVETVPDPNGLGIYESPELYDIFNDPYEMNNLVNDVRYSSVLSALHERLASGDF
jgi:arylsulfatase A-like enzyme